MHGQYEQQKRLVNRSPSVRRQQSRRFQCVSLKSEDGNGAGREDRTRVNHEGQSRSASILSPRKEAFSISEQQKRAAVSQAPRAYAMVCPFNSGVHQLHTVQFSFRPYARRAVVRPQHTSQRDTRPHPTNRGAIDAKRTSYLFCVRSMRAYRSLSRPSSTRVFSISTVSALWRSSRSGTNTKCFAMIWA